MDTIVGFREGVPFMRNPHYWKDLMVESPQKFLTILTEFRRRQNLNLSRAELVTINCALEQYEIEKPGIFAIQNLSPFFQSIREREMGISRQPREAPIGYTYDEHSD